MNRNKKGKQSLKSAQPSKKNQSTSSQPSMSRPQRSVAAAYSSGQHSGKPRIVRTSADSTHIVHRELVASITGSVNYTNLLSINCNPGLSASFPWLATQAQGWEKYRFNSLRFCYYTRTGSNVPGSVQLVPDYDAADAAPASEQIASAYAGVEEDAPWKDICCILDRERLREQILYVRTGGLSANQDIKTYDVANLFLNTLDGTAVPWGKLWVEYDIHLFNPQIPASGASSVGTMIGTVGTTAAIPFGTAPTSQGQLALSASALVITATGLQIGSAYDLTINSGGTVISVYSYAITSGATLVNTLFSGFPVAATTASCNRTFLATATTATFTISVTATTITNSTAIVTALPNPSQV